MLLVEYQFRTSEQSTAIVRQLKGPPQGIPIYSESEAESHISASVTDVRTGESGTFASEQDMLDWMELSKNGPVVILTTEI